jgi:hypothetical protein
MHLLNRLFLAVAIIAALLAGGLVMVILVSFAESRFVHDDETVDGTQVLRDGFVMSLDGKLVPATQVQTVDPTQDQSSLQRLAQSVDQVGGEVKDIIVEHWNLTVDGLRSVSNEVNRFIEFAKDPIPAQP